MKKIFLCLYFLLPVFTAFAYDFEVDGIFYAITNNSQKTVEVCSHQTTTQSTISLPEQVSNNGINYIVKSLADFAFSYSNTLINITIPNTVTSIGEYAFSDCLSLESVYIGSGVNRIGRLVFSECENLSSIIVDNNNSFFDSRDNCNAVIETAMNALAFGCRSTKIPDSVTSIKDAAFRHSNVTEIIIPNSVNSIGQYAFQNCKSLKNIAIPNSVTRIERNTFSYCDELESVTIGDGVTNIGEYAFHECHKLTSVSIGRGVNTIEFRAFSECVSLENVYIPDNVKKILRYAFSGCVNMINATIGKSVSEIGEYAFYRCWYLEALHSLNNTPPSAASNSFKEVTNYGCRLYVPKGSKEAYSKATGWRDFLTIAEEDPQGIIQICNSSISIETENGAIHITGVANNEPVLVFDLKGFLISTVVPLDGKASVEVPQGVTNVVLRVGKDMMKIQL